MIRPLGWALLAVGIALIVYGIHASDSVGSSFSRFFNGTPTDKTMWLLLGGIGSVVAGGVMSLRGARH
jgi:hypothetical protein